MTTRDHTRATTTEARRIGMADLQSLCAQILASTGLREDRAIMVADSLVDAEARGIGSHGVARSRIYFERLRAGLLDAEAEPTVAATSASTIHVDARCAVGHVGAAAGMSAAVDCADREAVGIAAVSNSAHCGTLAYFARRATAHGMVVIAMSTAPPTMAFHGGRSRAVGTNPICLAVPRSDDEPPIVLDMATSATARGKIILAERLGVDIPEGWAVDSHGAPTTNATAALAGAVLPFAGPKGSGLAMMIDLICGGLASGVMGSHIGDMYEDWSRPQQVSQLFVAIDPGVWIGREAFAGAVEDYVASIRALPVATGHAEVLLPGELEARAVVDAQRHGVVVPENVVADLCALADEARVSVPDAIAGGSES